MQNEGLATRNSKILNIQCLNNRYMPEEHIVEDFHYHKYNELLYLIKGDIEVYIYDKQYHAKEGSVILIQSNEPHTFYRPDGCWCIVLKFMPDILSAYSQTSAELEYDYLISNNVGDYPRIIPDDMGLRHLFVDAMKYFGENEFANELFIRADIIKIYAHIIRYLHKENYIKSISNKTSAENIAIIKKITAYLKENIDSINMHDAARMCGFSDGYFSRLFKEILGMTFTEYVKLTRINEAIKLLSCTDDTVTDIAQKLGYSSSSHFISDFKKAKGISPKQMRKNNKE